MGESNGHGAPEAPKDPREGQLRDGVCYCPEVICTVEYDCEAVFDRWWALEWPKLKAQWSASCPEGYACSQLGVRRHRLVWASCIFGWGYFLGFLVNYAVCRWL